MSWATRRTVVALAAWIAGAALSVSIGLLALSNISDRVDAGTVHQSAPWNAGVPSAGPVVALSSPAGRTTPGSERSAPCRYSWSVRGSAA